MPPRLPGEVGEIVRDLTEITRVGVDDGQTTETNESAYAELVEFVRVGVQLVFEELGPLRDQPPPPRGTAALKSKSARARQAHEAGAPR